MELDLQSMAERARRMKEKAESNGGVAVSYYREALQVANDNLMLIRQIRKLEEKEKGMVNSV